MKKIYLAAMLLSGTVMSFAQATIYNSNSSITSNRSVKLPGNYLRFYSNAGATSGLYINGTTGFVGVNTNSPSVNLDVNGDFQSVRGAFTNAPTSPQTYASYTERNNDGRVISAGYLNSATTGARTFGFYDFPASNYGAAETLLIVEDRSYMSRYRFAASEGEGGYMRLYDKNQVVNFTVDDDGSNNINILMPKPNTHMCIGTTSFSDGSENYSLSVNGSVRADKIKVYTTWADYVFAEDYKLPTLEEVEQHIEEKGHLIDVPSAAEVEEKGIELGEMNKILLQKIEELTLYIIDQKKQNDKQEAIIQDLQEKVNILTSTESKN